MVKISEPDEMPVDSDGNRADIVMDAGARISRMNISTLYMQYFNAASRDIKKKLVKLVKSNGTHKSYITNMTKLFHNNPNEFNDLYNYVMGYYKIVSPKMYDCFSNTTLEKKLEHMLSFRHEVIPLFIPTDNEPELIDMVLQTEKYYKPTYGPVTYKGNSGQTVTTVNNVRIGSVYIILLEKIADIWSAVSSGKLQHFGILSQLTKSDKYAQPVRSNPVKVVGEAEGDIFVSYAGKYVVAEIFDRNNNPNTHKSMVETILTHKTPTNIESLNDRQKDPYGGSRVLQLLAHIAMCAGWKYKYTSKKNLPTFDYQYLKGK